MNHVIELKHIDVRRQGRKILDDISLTVDEKESVAIIGAKRGRVSRHWWM